MADGEFLILVGPSGCGKSTALRLLAGLDKPTSGEIRIGGAVVNGLAPGERDIAMVFQNYALYPHMTVYRNLAYGLRQRRTPRAEVERRVRETAELLEIGELLDRKPGQLSGGQRQRVAMGRALVRKPQAFLLDEPLSNLDAKLRNQVRGDLKRLHRELPVTSIYVTHDQVEAMTLGDRLCVMSERRGAADRHHRRHLQPAGQHLRRGVHGQSADEPDARRRSRRRCCTSAGAAITAVADARRSGDGRRAARAPRGCTPPWPTAWCLRASTSSSRSAATSWSPRSSARRHQGDRAGAGGHRVGRRARAIGLAMPPERTYFFDAETGDAHRSRERIAL